MTKRRIAALFLLVLIPLSASAARTDFPDGKVLRISPGNHPAGETLFVPPLEEESLKREADPTWYQKTGAKKGLSGRAETYQEIFAAPDVAVLDRGFSMPWLSLLAQYQEPSVMVRPRDIAGLSTTKPLLIIPSGSLSATAGSDFFKAELAEYTRSGGVLFCLAQKNGADFSALPLPQGQRLEAAGWSEDEGPLFRASSIQGNHPLFGKIARPVPSLETDGYIINYPVDSRVLLLRPDGYPTVVVYPFGKGWVVVTTLFTDFSALLGRIESDEDTFLRNLLAWAKDPAKPNPAPGAAPPLPAKKAQTPDRSRAAETGKKFSRISIRARGERNGNALNLHLEIPPVPNLIDQAVIVRAGGREKTLTITSGKTSVAFEIPVDPSESRMSFAVYNKSNRSIARGSVAIPGRDTQTIGRNQAYYFPGDIAEVSISGMGKGELTLSGLRVMDSVIATDKGGMNIEIPGDLPAGSYPVHWKFEEIRGNKSQGALWIDLAGSRAAFRNVEIESKPDALRYSGTARFTIATSGKLSGKLSVSAKGPGGKSIILSEPVLSLAEGVHAIPVTFSFSPDRAGIWELVYNLSAALPQGVGIPDVPVALASGSSLFNIGDKAVLAVVPDKPFYYDSSGPVDLTIPIAGKGKTEIQILLDEKQLSREQVELTAEKSYRFSLPRLEAGSHVIRVSLPGGPLKNFADHLLIYGLRLPDLVLDVEARRPASAPQGPVMGITTKVSNQGKTSAPQARVGLYEGDPEQGGKLITRLDIPPLEPGRSHSALFDWPLYGKAGISKVYSRAEGDFQESNSHNNTGNVEVNIPEMLLILHADKSSIGIDDPLSVPVSVYNLTRKRVRDLSLDCRIEDVRKKVVSSGKIAVKEVQDKSESLVQAPLGTVYPPAGSYRFFARLSKEKELAADSMEVRILPGLMIAGAFEGMPDSAVPCKPFAFSYRIKDTGTVSPSSGTVRFEIFAAGREKPVYEKQFPLSLGDQKLSVDTREFSKGVYRALLSASLANQRYRLRKELMLAERNFSVTSPVEATRISTAFPRVLVWLGRDARAVEQALSETIIRQAFSQEDIYYKIVDTEQDFSAHAMTGMFNAYVLFETAEMPAKMDWLQGRLEHGQGIVVIGSGEIARSVGEYFGFVYDEAPVKNQPGMISFTGKSMDLSGNMPLSGKILFPRKKGSATAALYAPKGKPAVLVDTREKGKLMIMPLSLSRSAFAAGDTGLYSLVLRKSAFFVTPETDEPGGVTAGHLSVTSTTGPVKARIRELLPPGSKVLWTNAEGKADNNKIMYEVKADKDAKKLLYLYQPAAAEKPSASAEISYECNGVFVNQGKTE